MGERHKRTHINSHTVTAKRRCSEQRSGGPSSFSELEDKEDEQAKFYAGAERSDDALVDLLIEMKGDALLWERFGARFSQGKDSGGESRCAQEISRILRNQLKSTKENIAKIQDVLGRRRNGQVTPQSSKSHRVASGRYANLSPPSYSSMSATQHWASHRNQSPEASLLKGKIAESPAFSHNNSNNNGSKLIPREDLLASEREDTSCESEGDDEGYDDDDDDEDATSGDSQSEISEQSLRTPDQQKQRQVNQSNNKQGNGVIRLRPTSASLQTSNGVKSESAMLSESCSGGGSHSLKDAPMKSGEESRPRFWGLVGRLLGWRDTSPSNATKTETVDTTPRSEAMKTATTPTTCDVTPARHLEREQTTTSFTTPFLKMQSSFDKKALNESQMVWQSTQPSVSGRVDLTSEDDRDDYGGTSNSDIDDGARDSHCNRRVPKGNGSMVEGSSDDVQRGTVGTNAQQSKATEETQCRNAGEGLATRSRVLESVAAASTAIEATLESPCNSSRGGEIDKVQADDDGDSNSSRSCESRDDNSECSVEIVDCDVEEES